MTWFSRLVAAVTAAGLGLVLAVSSVSALASNELLAFDNDDLRERYGELVFQLRCPKCQNQNVADSNAPIAEDIREKTYEMLHQGYTNQEIIDFMIERYTEFVIYKPQLSVVTIWLWIVPVSILVIGLAVLFNLTRRANSKQEVQLTAEESQRVKMLLEDKY